MGAQHQQPGKRQRPLELGALPQGNGDTEDQPLGTPIGAQHQPPEKRRRPLEPGALPQGRKGLRRCPGSENLRAEALKQASSSCCKSSGNALSGDEVAMEASRPAIGREPACRTLTKSSAANGHVIAQPTTGRHLSGSRNENQPHRGQWPSRWHVPNNVRRLSPIQEESPNQGSPLSKTNYWATEGRQGLDGDASGFKAPVGHHRGPRALPGEAQPRIPTKEYAAVRPDNPALSSPKTTTFKGSR